MAEKQPDNIGRAGRRFSLCCGRFDAGACFLVVSVRPSISALSALPTGQAAAFGFEKGPTGRQLKRRMINMMVHLKGRSAIVTGSNVCSFVWFADLMS